MRRHGAATIPEVSTPLAPAESVRIKPPRKSAMGSVIGHTGFSVARYHSTHVFGALFPLSAGLLLFGWRAGLSIAIVLLCTAIAGAIWRRIGKRGHPLRPAQLLWLGLVLALMLPPSLMVHTAPGQSACWPILPVAALLLVIFSWSVGSFCPGRLHPSVAVFLLLAMMFGPLLNPHAVLQHNHLLTGDVTNAPGDGESRALQSTWRLRPIVPNQDAIRSLPPAQTLLEFSQNKTAQSERPDTMETLLRDRLPPLEDLVLGATPGAIGVTSAIAVIIGGLFLLYRGLIDFRIPLLITATAWIVLMILPLPGVIASLPQWTWLPSRIPGVGWGVAITFANYEVLGSPLLFTAFFLAGSPTVRPMGRRARAVYAILIGVLTAIFQLYLSVTLGSYLALLIAGMTTPVLDKKLASKPLV